ncbi:MAG: class I SAM-dependent methyltransferase [Eubacteriales bacterium]|nr:class I SAM-dependent methyltransferase [Eubacteriales bacterium]MDD4582698.1 class I SAM-dependent methyltransferase [Eubacteriales bacterium]
MLKLPNRLLTIAGCIEQGEAIADIGTDHGLLPIFLYQQGISSKIILSDNKEGPLEKARRNLFTYLPDENIDIRLGNGLIPLDYGEVNTVIIAGMGGRLIIDILEEDHQKTRSFGKYILQPRNAQDKLRMWLFRHGFTIVDEHLVRERHHICEIIIATTNSYTFQRQHVSKEQIKSKEAELAFEVSSLLLYKQDQLVKEFLERKILKEKHIIQEILVKGGGKDLKRIIESKNRLEKLQILFDQATDSAVQKQEDLNGD